MKLGLSSLLAMVLFVLSPAAGPAGAVENNEGVYDLGRIVVSESREQGVASIETVKTVTAQEIKERNARTLDEAMQLIPGIIIRTGADGTPRIDMRGFRTRNVVLLLNGTPFNSTFDGQFDPSLISVENIAEIKVITGAASVLYGPGGNGGVINIITKKGKPGIHGSVVGEGAQGSSYLVKGTLSGGTDKIDSFVSGSVQDREGFRLSDDFTPTKYENGGLRENSDFHRDNVFANLGYSPGERTSLGLTFSYLRGERGKPPVVNYDKNDPFSSNLTFQRENDSANYATQFAVSHQLGGPFSLSGRVFYNQLDLVENRYDDDTYSTQTQKGSSQVNSTTQIGGANFQLRCDLQEAGLITLGFSGESDSWQADGFQVVEQDQGNQKDQKDKNDKNKDKTTVTTVRQFFDDSRDLQVYSALLEYEASPIKKLGILAGLGIHWQDREGGTQGDFSYLVGAHYDLFEGTRFKVHHARKIRFPTIKDLYDPDSGNPNLTTERSLHYEAGVEQRLPANTVFSLTGFLSDVDDFIEKDADDRYRNFEKYQFKGFEVALENRFIKNLMLRASYSYLDSKDESEDSERDELQYRPRDKVALEGNYRCPWGTSFYASVLYVANQRFYDKNVVMKSTLPAYVLVDMKISQAFFNDALNVYVGANNIFDEDYEQSYGFPQAGRTIYGGVGYRF